MKLDYRKIFKAVSKSKVKPILQKLFVKNGYVYATDSYKAVRLKTDYDLDQKGYITSLSAIVAHEKTKEVGAIVLPELTEIDIDFPDVDKIVPTDFMVTIACNRKYLLELLMAMQSTKPFDEIIIKIPKERNKPIVIISDNGLGLLMPINK